MMLIIEAVVAAALGAAIISLIILLRFFMAIPVCKVTGGQIFTVISASGTAHELENAVASLRWLIQTGRLNCKILIIDCGLDDSARYMAQLMMTDEPFIMLCSPDDAADILTKG